MISMCYDKGVFDLLPGNHCKDHGAATTTRFLPAMKPRNTAPPIAPY